MEIKKLNPDDVRSFSDLVEIFKEVFENEEEVANPAQLKKMLANPDFLVFVVIIDGKIIGGLTVYVLHPYYQSKPLAYIYDVGIAPAFQRKGFGRALIAEVCDFCQQQGFEDAYVAAESDDIEAVNFYRKTRFSTEMNVKHFTYSFDNRS